MAPLAFAVTPAVAVVPVISGALTVTVVESTFYPLTESVITITELLNSILLIKYLTV
jgi:hypothetical protein